MSNTCKDSKVPDKRFKKTANFDSNNHQLKKRQPQKFEQDKTVIYVSGKSNIKALLNKCDKLVFDGETEIILYCMGAAIQRGILLALQFCEKHPTYKSSVNTFTSQLTDDLEPVTDEVDYEFQHRQNSALKIRLFRAVEVK